jgi:3-dehydroquinate synthase
MQTIQTPNYPIFFVNENWSDFQNLINKNTYSKIFILTDQNTSEHCLPLFLQNFITQTTIEIIELESGEATKNIYTCVDLWQTLIDLGGDRKSLLINLGGGVITDMGGFVAATFKRGIDFVNIPTTLLSMVDAAVGGKNGVDLGNLKNQIGTIQDPLAVVVFTAFLSTLNKRELRSGLAEMLKHGLIFDKKHWEDLKNMSNLDSLDLDSLIFDSVHIKKIIVGQDKTENGIRKTLNFGHTIGHAIESYFLENKPNPLLHGEAIAIGMILESHISLQLGFISNEQYAEIKYIITEYFEKVSLDKNDLEKIIDLLIFDKKNEYGKIQFSLLVDIGVCKWNFEVDNSLIYKAFEDYMK